VLDFHKIYSKKIFSRYYPEDKKITGVDWSVNMLEMAIIKDKNNVMDYQLENVE
jgi:ubiquinone/menaquinone biosynthesis C-methylase UbiE